ncbi:MAG: tRNA 4-thiouridine(8) synthase ThiI [Clostridia bacterium]|nr:tRNA 4-thiouridine(8) synthase ThiI [Clostridia bacterium]
MEQLILAKCGEIVLKGLNRSKFDLMLIKNLKRSIADLGEFDISLAQSTVYIRSLSGADMEEVFARTKRVFGFAAVCMAYMCEKSMESILGLAPECLAETLEEVNTFKVEAKRSDKRFPLKSPEICREVGGELLKSFPHLRVDVHHPDVTVTVEVRDFGAYIHAVREPGAGGMPYGSNGRACLLLSGGIDSPVAGYMMAKRGLKLTGIHFFSPPYTGERAKQKVVTLAKELQAYCPGMKLHVVHFTEAQEAIRDHCSEEYFTVIMRRMMMRVAYELMKKTRSGALITGESLGQVASQTMDALQLTDSVTNALVLRPLIGMDKEEIVQISRRIGTFDTSIQPYEDCCTVFTPKHPKTKPTLRDIEREEAKLDIEGLVDRAVHLNYEIIE